MPMRKKNFGYDYPGLADPAAKGSFRINVNPGPEPLHERIQVQTHFEGIDTEGNRSAPQHKAMVKTVQELIDDGVFADTAEADVFVSLCGKIAGKHLDAVAGPPK